MLPENLLQLLNTERTVEDQVLVLFDYYESSYEVITKAKGEADDDSNKIHIKNIKDVAFALKIFLDKLGSRFSELDINHVKSACSDISVADLRFGSNEGRNKLHVFNENFNNIKLLVCDIITERQLTPVLVTSKYQLTDTEVDNIKKLLRKIKYDAERYVTDKKLQEWFTKRIDAIISEFHTLMPDFDGIFGLFACIFILKHFTYASNNMIDDIKTAIEVCWGIMVRTEGITKYQKHFDMMLSILESKTDEAERR